MVDTNTKIYIANLGKYNEGELVGAWLNLPTNEEELQETFDKICLNDEYEEYAIHDYESGMGELEIGEFEDIETLSENIEQIENLDEYEYIALRAFLENTVSQDIDNALKNVNDGNFCIYNGCNNMEDVAMEYVYQAGILESMPENLQCYFDFKAYGRDMEIEGTFIFIDGDCVEFY
ncbi:MAG: antirestriction protein ArdA [Rikenellaceae bacterium]